MKSRPFLFKYIGKPLNRLPKMLAALLFFVSWSHSQSFAPSPGWEELNDSRGWIYAGKTGRVTLFTKKISLSPIPAIRLEMETTADPKTLLELVWAVDQYPETLPSAHIISSGITERKENWQRAWQVVDIPFLAPRLYRYDHLYRANRIDWKKTDNGTSSPDFDGLLIPPVNIGSWEILKQGDTTVLVYRVCTDPGGDVPAWIVERANKRYLPQMLLELEAAALRKR